MGIDFHRLQAGRKLIIGGVEIKHERGLVGHSDADVLLHALCDALLGAAGLGDIGNHFPDTEERYKDMASTEILAQVNAMIRDAGMSVNNIDAVVIAEGPKLAPYIPDMLEVISKVLGVPQNNINIKATTAEGLGAIGRGEGIAAHVVAVLEEG